MFSYRTRILYILHMIYFEVIRYHASRSNKVQSAPMPAWQPVPRQTHTLFRSYTRTLACTRYLITMCLPTAVLIILVINHAVLLLNWVQLQIVFFFFFFIFAVSAFERRCWCWIYSRGFSFVPWPLSSYLEDSSCRRLSSPSCFALPVSPASPPGLPCAPVALVSHVLPPSIHVALHVYHVALSVCLPGWLSG